jgi:hypothetical protein
VPFGPPLADDMIKDINRSLKYCQRPNQREGTDINSWELSFNFYNYYL